MITRSPKEIYQQNVEDGAIRTDSAQEQGVYLLQDIYEQLQENIQHKSSWFSRLFQSPTLPIKGAYLWGGVGTGKTLLMDIFFESLAEGISKRIHFHRFMQSIHDQKNRIKNQQDPLKIIARQLAEKFRVLCLDEFTVTDITDAMILSGLLDNLFRNGVILVTTSNTEIQNLYLHGLQRERFLVAINLLETHTTQIQIDSGSDYRMAYLQKDGIYHTPLGEKSQRSIEQAFQRLAGLYENSKQQIALSGRDVDVVATGSGVVWFEFKSLCMTSRSKLDYIELSKRFHTVILTNIPLLGHTFDDPARRLIELIDELYDRSVNVIVSAAASPESLYIGKRLAEPFKRTASRLQEMSSPEYLAKPHLQ